MVKIGHTCFTVPNLLYHTIKVVSVFSLHGMPINTCITRTEFVLISVDKRDRRILLKWIEEFGKMDVRIDCVHVPKS